MINPEDHLKLAFFVTRKFVKDRNPIKDSIEYSLACEALVKAARAYDPNNGEFSTFACGAMINEINQYLRYNKSKKRSAVVLQQLQFDEWNEIPSKQKLQEEDLLSWLHKLSANWSEQDKEDLQILLAVKFNKEKVGELAIRLGVSRQTIHTKLHKITDKLKNAA